MKYKLSKISITGKVTNETPFVVLKEIELCSGVHISNKIINNKECIDNLIYRINYYSDENIVESPFSEKSLRKISSFINPNVNWDRESLINAFYFLIENFYEENVMIPNREFRVGLQTPNRIENLNSRFLYKICKYKNLKTSLYTTIEEMRNSIYITFIEPKYGISLILENLENLNKEELSQFYMISSINSKSNENNLNSNNTRKNIKSRKLKSRKLKSKNFNNFKNFKNNIDYTYKSLESCFSLFSDIDEVLKRITPTNNSEAIALAAKIYRIDLTKSSNPMIEYLELNKEKSEYYPKDIKIIEMLRSDPLCISLDHTFNPYLPCNFYDNSILRRIAVREGYNLENLGFNNIYEVLQVLYFSNTFYQGKLDSNVNNETYFTLENIDLFHPSEIVSFGVKEEKTHVFSFEELYSMFNANNSFENPLTKEEFSEVSIKKLENICSYISENQTLFSIESRKKLIKSIKRIKIFNDESKKSIQDFIKMYESESIENKEEIEMILEILLKLSMFMRGWKGYPYPFPISEALVENQNLVDINVTKYIIKFEKIVKKSKFGKIISNLPLVNWRASDFYISSNESDGITIMDRINIVKANDSVYSCIRISSNFLSSTCHYYMGLLDLEEPFDILELATIG